MRPLSPTLRTFPLPELVLFPEVLIPLHIFEPRYRTMLADALADDHLIGMVLARASQEIVTTTPATESSDDLDDTQQLHGVWMGETCD